MAQFAKRMNGKIKIRPDLSSVTLIQEHTESRTAYVSERSRSVRLIRPQQAHRQMHDCWIRKGSVIRLTPEQICEIQIETVRSGDPY